MKLLNRYSLKFYEGAFYKDAPVLISIRGQFHTRVLMKGFSISVDNDELSSLDKPYLMVPFYKNKEIKILKEKKYSLIIETEDFEEEVNKKDIKFFLCNINESLIQSYADKYGMCFLLPGENKCL